MNATEQRFVREVKAFYKKEGRHDLPWRQTADPYRITVSEIMLQQTQVPRVLHKYHEFLKAFPTLRTLAAAPLRDVLRTWSGLGYNRRAKFLHQMAQSILRDHDGKFPTSLQELKQLPGIGPYTAGAIYAFAFNQPEPIIETNIRTVYIHHFFKDKKDISDKEIMKKVIATLDHKNPREWYWALMDYGSHLKSFGIKNNAKSKHYTKQSKFEGSKRQVRGAIMRELIKGDKTLSQIVKAIGKEKMEVEIVMVDLVKEGMIKKVKGNYIIA